MIIANNDLDCSFTGQSHLRDIKSVSPSVMECLEGIRQARAAEGAEGAGVLTPLPLDFQSALLSRHILCYGSRPLSSRTFNN